ncbi:MAG TPA: hypothetical protein VLH77_03635, partial [Gammaproteobacteria bacterium]|nr:hypothetical protein [Gammaproteobacteria bacterium]
SFSMRLGLDKIHLGLVGALEFSKWTDLITHDSYKDCFKYLLHMCEKQARVKEPRVKEHGDLHDVAPKKRTLN